jgi:hypothetical protein
MPGLQRGKYGPGTGGLLQPRLAMRGHHRHKIPRTRCGTSAKM